MPKLVREFLDYNSVIKNRSKNTIISYYGDIRLFLRFTMQKKNIVPSDIPLEKIDIENFPEELLKEVTLSDAFEFLHFMNDERGNNAKSRAKRAVVLKRFFKFLTDNKLMFSKSPLYNLELPSPPKTVPKYMTLSQAKALLEVSSKDESFEKIRNFCIHTFFLNCGMRLAELIAINISDVRTDTIGENKIVPEATGREIYYLFVRGKGNKERIIYFNDACTKAYLKYIECRKEYVEKFPVLKKEPALFITSRKKRISRRCVQVITEKAINELGLKDTGLSVHKLRHTAATLMYQNGVDIHVLREVLGHENLNTTQIYTHISNKQVMNAFLKNPLGEGKE